MAKVLAKNPGKYNHKVIKHNDRNPKSKATSLTLSMV
jgi:hypothetical protein